METETITEIGIDAEGRLFVRPDVVRFVHIWRSATEVHWNDAGGYLYSPRPRDRSYIDWYRHIINVVENECNLRLVISDKVIWTNVDNQLKLQITTNK